MARKALFVTSSNTERLRPLPEFYNDDDQRAEQNKVHVRKELIRQIHGYDCGGQHERKAYPDPKGPPKAHVLRRFPPPDPHHQGDIPERQYHPRNHAHDEDQFCHDSGSVIYPPYRTQGKSTRRGSSAN